MMLLFLVYIFINPILADYSMIEVYGKPKDFESVNTIPGYTWKSCILFCWSTPECVLAHNIQPDECQWFSHTNISTVEQTLSSDGYLVAFKINTTSSICLTGTNPPTFDNKPVSGSATYMSASVKPRFGPIRFNYTISYSANLWTFSFTQKTACKDYFYFVPRKTTPFCLVFLDSYPYKTTANDANGDCSTFEKSFSTGIGGSAEEFESAKETLISVRSYFNVQDLVLRADGRRTASCEKTPTTEDCMTAKGFTFNDLTSNSIDGYKWASNPGAQKTANSNCIVLILNKNEEIVADVQSCGLDTSLTPFGLVCGKFGWDW